MDRPNVSGPRQPGHPSQLSGGRAPPAFEQGPAACYRGGSGTQHHGGTYPHAQQNCRCQLRDASCGHRAPASRESTLRPAGQGSRAAGPSIGRGPDEEAWPSAPQSRGGAQAARPPEAGCGLCRNSHQPRSYHTTRGHGTRHCRPAGSGGTIPPCCCGALASRCASCAAPGQQQGSGAAAEAAARAPDRSRSRPDAESAASAACGARQWACAVS